MVETETKNGGLMALFPSLADKRVENRVKSAQNFVKQLTLEELEEEKRKQVNLIIQPNLI